MRMQIRIMTKSSRFRIFPQSAKTPAKPINYTLIEPGRRRRSALLFGKAGRNMRTTRTAIVATCRGAGMICEPRGGGADMNKWVIAAILVAVAVFMYVSIIYKMA